MPGSEPKNFDHVHDSNREFILAGELFHWEPVWFETYGEWVDKTVAQNQIELARIEEERRAAEREGREPRDVSATLVDTFESLIEQIKLYLVPEDVDRFDATIRDPKNRVSSLQLNELRNWLSGVQTERPTEPPTPSANGPGRTVAISPVPSR